MQKPIKAWVSAMRLRTLPLAAASILGGNAIALSKDINNATVFLLALLTTLLLQILSNLANDLGDGIKGTDNDERLGPKRSIQSGSITLQSMKRGVALFAILALISGLMLLYISVKQNTALLYFFLTLGIVSILAALTYTMGKKAYGYSGFGDIFVFLFFGLVGVLGSQYLITQSIFLQDIFPAVTIGLLSTAVLNMNNMRDYKNDAKSNKNTLVVIMGFNKAKIYHSLLLIFALISHVVFLSFFPFKNIYLISFLPFIFLVINLVKVTQNTHEKELDKELKIIALSTFILSITLNIIFWL